MQSMSHVELDKVPCAGTSCSVADANAQGDPRRLFVDLHKIAEGSYGDVYKVRRTACSASR